MRVGVSLLSENNIGNENRMSTKPTKNDWPDPQIDPKLCNGCNRCVQVCPHHALELRNNIAVVAHPQKCEYSGLCVKICPQKAIQLVFEIYLFDDD
jgi:NAD-dependent dihydropyrimidine dehydrogenase PreA subunit